MVIGGYGVAPVAVEWRTKRISASATGPGGESMDVSKRLPSRLPAGSSRVPRTISLYAPARHVPFGANVHAHSPIVNRARPATRRPFASALAQCAGARPPT